MDALTEYFVRHYTLVLDNDQGTYYAAVDAARVALAEDGPTLEAYRALSASEREHYYAREIGESILNLIEEWLYESESESTVARLLIREIMITSSSDVAYGLGVHYMPEPDDMDGFLDAEDEDEDDN